MRALYPRALGPFVLIAPATPWEGEPASLALTNTGPLFEERLALVAHVPIETSAVTVRDRFRARCEQLARLRHPGLPRFRESGEAEGELFAARDHMVGRSLAQLQSLVRQEGLSIPTTVAIFVAREVVAALAYLHAFEGHGLVHDAIDAGSVLISFHGQVTLQGGRYGRVVADAEDGEAGDARTDVAAWIAMLREILGVTSRSLPGVSALSLPESCFGTLWGALAAEKPAVLPASAWVELLDRVLASQPGAQAELAALMLLFPEDREREDRTRAMEAARPLLAELEALRAPGSHGAHSSPTVQTKIPTRLLDESGALAAPSGTSSPGAPTLGASAPGESSARLALAKEDGAIPQPIPPRRTLWAEDRAESRSEDRSEDRSDDGSDDRSDDRAAAFLPAGKTIPDAAEFAEHEAAFFVGHGGASGDPRGAAGARGAVRAAAAVQGRPPLKSLKSSVASWARPSARRSAASSSSRTMSRGKGRGQAVTAWLGLAVAGSLSFAAFWWLQPLRRAGSGAELSLSSPLEGVTTAPPSPPSSPGSSPRSSPASSATSSPAPSIVQLAGPAPEEVVLPSPSAQLLPAAILEKPDATAPSRPTARTPAAEALRPHFSQARKQPGGPSTRPMRVQPTLSAGHGSEAEALAAVLSRARFAYVNEAFDEAIAGARQALTMGAGAEAHALLGNAYIGKHSYRDAEREYVRTLALDPLDMHSRDRLEWLRARRTGPVSVQ